MSVPRADFGAVALPSGKVLLVGGLTSPTAATAKVDLYDPATNTMAAAAPMAAARSGHSAVLLPNGKVLVAGGVSNPNGGAALASAELYDPGTDTWSAAAPMAEARAHHAAVVMGNSKVLVAGGDGGSGPAARGSEIYDPGTNTWTSIVSVAPRTHGPTATVLNDGRVMIANGLQQEVPMAWQSVEFYDPARAQPSGAPTATPYDRSYSTAALLGDGRVIVAGGQLTYNPTGAVNTTAIYDPTKDVGNSGMPGWTSGPAMNVGHCHHTMTTLKSGVVLVVGGRCQSDSIAVAELLDPAATKWSLDRAMLAARGNHTAVLLQDGRVLVAGGFGTGGAVVDTTELYTPA